MRVDGLVMVPDVAGMVVWVAVVVLDEERVRALLVVLSVESIRENLLLVVVGAVTLAMTVSLPALMVLVPGTVSRLRATVPVEVRETA